MTPDEFKYTPHPSISAERALELVALLPVRKCKRNNDCKYTCELTEGLERSIYIWTRKLSHRWHEPFDNLYCLAQPILFRIICDITIEKLKGYSVFAYVKVRFRRMLLRELSEGEGGRHYRRSKHGELGDEPRLTRLRGEVADDGKSDNTDDDDHIRRQTRCAYDPKYIEVGRMEHQGAFSRDFDEFWTVERVLGHIDTLFEGKERQEMRCFALLCITNRFEDSWKINMSAVARQLGYTGSDAEVKKGVRKVKKIMAVMDAKDRGSAAALTADALGVPHRPLRDKLFSEESRPGIVEFETMLSAPPVDPKQKPEKLRILASESEKLVNVLREGQFVSVPAAGPSGPQAA